jgi:hypothetical protein
MRKDSVFDSRYQECVRTRENGTCFIASVSHPNVAGAAAYTRAIQDQLSPFVGQWGLDHSDTIAAASASLYVYTEYGARSESGGTLTVRAADWATGAEVAGQVAFDGSVAGEFGRPVTYTYRATDPVAIITEVRPQGHPVQRFTIPVRSAAVHVSQQTFQSRNRLTRSLTVTAKDRQTGLPLNGTVRAVGGDGRSVTGATGSPIQYPACITTIIERGPNDKPIEVKEDIECAATLSVPYYPRVQFADQAGDY